jgi:hypothetical protein
MSYRPAELERQLCGPNPTDFLLVIERLESADVVEKVGFEVVAVPESGDRENRDNKGVASGC